MNNLEMQTLQRYCDKHNLDPAEIDDTLTYYENKNHLKKLARRLSQDTPGISAVDSMLAEYAAYMFKHILHFYAACQLTDDSEGVGDPVPPPPKGLFSLKDYVST